MTVKVTKGATLGQFLRYLSPEFTSSRYVPSWPPDIFGATASILEKCGAYIRLVSVANWPPGKKSRSNTKAKWIKEIRKTGAGWRASAVASKRPPRPVMVWWKHILAHRSMRLEDVYSDRSVCDALLQLCSAADEACMGAGIPNRKGIKIEPFQLEVRKHFANQLNTTLCKTIDRSKLCVLPKLHTPQSGMTVRSLSHHLALCPTGDVDARWVEILGWPDSHCLNLLLIPWPETTTPNHFQMVPGKHLGMSDEFGFFTYDRPRQPPNDLCSLAMDLYRNARKIVGRVDGVILPELALNKSEYACLGDAVINEGAFLLCGIREPGSKREPGRNYLSFDVPFTPEKVHRMHYEQPKHHRWLLDKRQIVQYGLGGTLDLRRSLWEWMNLEPRALTFFSLHPWLSLCALLCEDLARQDPVAEIVRAVGPNLVIALLMDGPQLAQRWSARYATVLADDPGSSVLTLTSAGMVKLSRPPHIRKASRVVGLWKDPYTADPVPIELPEGVDALLLSLNAQNKQEWAADGRDDLGGTGVPVFGGIHPVVRSKR